jgi:hypothetical protein
VIIFYNTATINTIAVSCLHSLTVLVVGQSGLLIPASQGSVYLLLERSQSSDTPLNRLGNATTELHTKGWVRETEGKTASDGNVDEEFVD